MTDDRNAPAGQVMAGRARVSAETKSRLEKREEYIASFGGDAGS
jgi:hypothetical protein